jgi:hypothetical protein
MPNWEKPGSSLSPLSVIIYLFILIFSEHDQNIFKTHSGNAQNRLGTYLVPRTASESYDYQRASGQGPSVLKYALVALQVC